MALLKVIFRWVLGKAGLLLLLIVLLMLLPSVEEAIRVLATFNPETFAQQFLDELKQIVPDKGEAQEEVEKKQRELQVRLANKRQESKELGERTCVLPTCSLVRDANRYYVALQIRLLEQATEDGENIWDTLQACEALRKYGQQLIDLEIIEEALERERCWGCPRTAEHQRISDRIAELKILVVVKERVCRAKNVAVLSLAAAVESADSEFRNFKDHILDLQNAKNEFIAKAKLLLPTAFATLLGIIFIPIVAKLAAYYLVGPWASRRDGSNLFPDSAGSLSIGESKVGHVIHLDADHELMIGHALVKGASASAVSDTKPVLDWTMPFSSMAAGLYWLQRIRTKSTATVNIAAPDGAVGRSALAVLSLPQGTALVLHPSCLVGVVQRIDRPLQISRHWQLGYLSSWFSMRLRHIVFHAPAELILHGNMGVKIDEVQGASTHKRTFTLGYSANLSYCVDRSKPLYPYMNGVNELFDDKFVGNSGYCVVEATPAPPNGFAPTRWIHAIIRTIFDLLGL